MNKHFSWPAYHYANRHATVSSSFRSYQEWLLTIRAGQKIWIDTFSKLNKPTGPRRYQQITVKTVGQNFLISSTGESYSLDTGYSELRDSKIFKGKPPISELSER